jgi:hypothetical protein
VAQRRQTSPADQADITTSNNRNFHEYSTIIDHPPRRNKNQAHCAEKSLFEQKAKPGEIPGHFVQSHRQLPADTRLSVIFTIHLNLSNETQNTVKYRISGARIVGAGCLCPALRQAFLAAL